MERSGARQILVEGVSDRAALEALALRRSLAPPHIVVLGGAHAVARYVRAAQDGVELAALCDAQESPIFRRVLHEVHVCAPDLEGEFIRALGVERVQQVIESQGELDSFRTLQRQPAQLGKPLAAQLTRFLAGRAGNKERYARLLVDALDLARVPPPLDAILGR